MGIRLSNHFDSSTLGRPHDYVDRGLVVLVETQPRGAVVSRVSNGRGQFYNQHIALHGDAVFGACSCPMGQNCKHVAAALIYQAPEHGKNAGSLAAPVQAWLSRVRQSATTTASAPDRAERYPSNIKDRLLFCATANSTVYRGFASVCGRTAPRIV